MEELQQYITDIHISDKWIEMLIEAIGNGLATGRKVVVVGIARKMSRLLWYFRLRNARLDEALCHAEVITEHAVPFVLDEASTDNVSVIIVDDLIVSGDTVETVAENIFYFCGIRSKIIAMAAVSDRFTTLPCMEVVYPLPAQDGDAYISVPDVASFTAYLGDQLLTLQRSVDLEHTIMSRQWSYNAPGADIASIINKIDREFPDEKVYPVSHHIPYTDLDAANVTVSIRRYQPLHVANDFSKFRIFFGNEKISVTAFAPNIWKNNEIWSDNIRFHTEGLDRIWTYIKGYLAEIQSRQYNHEPLEWKNTIMRDNFRHRCEHTAVIMANYLVSFDSMMMLRPNFRNIFGFGPADSDGFDLDITDLILIIGKDCGNKVRLDLDRVVKDNPEVRPEFRYNYAPYLSIMAEPLGDKEQVRQFESQMVSVAYQSYSLNAALSLIFTYMRDSFGQLATGRREDRMPYGVTFDFLEKILSRHYPKSEVRGAIEKWIDSNIDLGVVVPKYEFSRDWFDSRIWRRYFRDGEREAQMTAIARLSHKLIIAKIGADKVEYKEFRDHIVPLLKSLNHATDGQVDLALFSEGVMRSSDTDPVRALWVYMILMGLIRAVDLNDMDTVRVLLSDKDEESDQPTALYAGR